MDRSPNLASPPGSKARKISRRQFGRAAAIATAASFGVSGVLASGATAVPPAEADSAAAESAPSPAESAESRVGQEKPRTAPAAQAKTPEPLKGLTPKQVADVDAKLANILRKHPNRFSVDQKKRLRRILAQHERLLAPVHAFQVQNGDPPASVLRVSFSDVSLPLRKRSD